MEKHQVVLQIQDPNLYLFNLVSSCLLKEFRFYDSSDERRDLLIKALQKVADTDPEFVLQLAYYLRNQLYLRTTTNFILAFASIHERTAPFLHIYFDKSVLLPSDFLEVCQWSQIIYYLKENEYNFDKLDEVKSYEFRKNLKFSQYLKEALKRKFQAFSMYHLGKYCSEARRKKILREYQDILNPERKNKRQKKLRKKNSEKARLEEKANKIKEKAIEKEEIPKKNRKNKLYQTRNGKKSNCNRFDLQS